MKWKCKEGYGTETNPSIASDGTIYVGGKYLYAINPNGTIKWSFNLGSNRHIHQSSPAISSDGTIYVGTNIGETSGGHIIAINPNGTERWREKIADEWVESSPCIGKDGTVYIGSMGINDGYLYAFGPLDPDAPSAPLINGKTIGKTGKEYEYTFKSTSPLGRDVYYYIEWGDGSKKDWFGPYGSGEEVKASHTWPNQGTYTIRARAKDTDNLWGPWGELVVTMPRNRATTSSLYLWFLERYSILERFLTLLVN